MKFMSALKGKSRIIKYSMIIIVVLALGYVCLQNGETKIEVSGCSLEQDLLKRKFDTKVAYLTFDDGPSVKETEKILKILEEQNVKATFFVLGKQVKEHPEIVKKAYNQGHYIANHGYSHENNKLYKSEENFVSEIINTDFEISKAIGEDSYKSKIFRFPNGYKSNLYKKQKKWAIEKLSELDYVYIDWNCLNKDSEVKTTNWKLMKNLKETSEGKETIIILMHDTGDVNITSDVLAESIEYLKKNGYEFRTMYDFV